MYLLDKQVVIEWEILPTTTVPILADFKLVEIRPNGDMNYYSNYQWVSYVPPTDTENGLLTQTFTPTLEGLWELRLAIGVETRYVIQSRIEMQVFRRSLFSVGRTIQLIEPVGARVYIVNYTEGGELTAGQEPGDGAVIPTDADGNLPANIDQLAIVLPYPYPINGITLEVSIPTGYIYTAVSLFGESYNGPYYDVNLLDQAFDEFIAAGMPAGFQQYAGGFTTGSTGTGNITNNVYSNSYSSSVNAEVKLPLDAMYGGGSVIRFYAHQQNDTPQSGVYAQIWVSTAGYL